MTIPVNKKRFPILMLAGLLLLFFSISFLLTQLRYTENEDYDKSIYLNIGITIASSLVILTFTILSALEYVKTLFDKNAALTITDSGINDNLSIFSVGDIKWTEITDIKISNVLNTDFLIIGVTNPQAFIDRMQILKRRPLRSSLKKFGSPIAISQKRVDYDLNNLKDILIQKRPK